MPTLLEKPAANSGTPVQPPVVLRSSHRWLHWRGLLFSGIVGLAITLITLGVIPASWRTPVHLAEIWAAGFFITGTAMVIAWRLSPRSLIATAQTLDKRYAAKNRLEAVAILKDSTSPLAQAQREETARHLEREAQARTTRVLPWLVALFVALLAAHLICVILWAAPFFRPAPKLVAPPPPSKEMPKASIIWVSPAAETKANPVEEVPTVATANSTTGLSNLTLEISNNGVPKKSTPIPAEPYDKPGAHSIKVSVYLDEIDAQPFDVVSYYLRGQRIANEQKLPDTTSPIQFIQVRPFRDDVHQAAGHGSKGYALLIRLKLAQLQSVKENFVLAHTDLPPNHPVRMKENGRVGKNEVELGKKTGEVVQAFIDEGAPAAIVDLLQQAEPLMGDAGKKILAVQNNEALVPQQKALSQIVEAEKYFIHIMGPATGPKSADPNDPFKDKQKHEMTKRLTAPSGQLETLARNQAHLSQDLDNSKGDSSSTPADAAPAQPAPATPAPGATDASATKDAAPLAPAIQAVDPFGPDAEKGSLTERQTRVLQGVSVLQNGNTVFPPAVSDALASAQKDASQSLRMLNDGQDAGAREPAAAAARDLQQAVAAMNATGDAESKEAMSDAQQKMGDLAARLRELAGNPSPDAAQKLADMANQMDAVRQDLEAAADHQQETGSAKGANQLNQLAQKIRDGQFASKLADMGKSGLDPGKASALANLMEDAANQGVHVALSQASGQDYATLINALERTRANLERLASRANGGQMPDAAKPDSSGTTPDAGGKDQGAQKGQGQGQQQAQDGKSPGQGHEPDEGQGQVQQAQAQGQSPGQGQSQTQGQGHGEGRTPGEAQTQGQGHDQGQGQNQSQQQAGNQGNGQTPNPQEAQGQGAGQEQGKDRGDGQGQGQQSAQGQNSPAGSENPATDSGQGQGQNPHDQQASAGKGEGNSGEGAGSGSGQTNTNQNGGNGNGTSSGQPDSPLAMTDATLQAYREALENLKNQTQQTSDVLHTKTADDLRNLIIHNDKDTTYRPITPVDVVKFYVDLQKPLNQMILDLQAAQQHVQRDEVVKAPNLDDSPVAYRAAVSDYFESVSRDYHPPAPPPPPADDAKP